MRDRDGREEIGFGPILDRSIDHFLGGLAALSGKSREQVERELADETEVIACLAGELPAVFACPGCSLPPGFSFGMHRPLLAADSSPRVADGFLSSIINVLAA
jgi:hypothetical protein